MKKATYNLIFNAEPEGGFTVTVPSLPGCVTYGKNLTEAKKMAKEAIGAYLASLKKHEEIAPNDEHSFFSTMKLHELTLAVSSSFIPNPTDLF